jgi:hypothetical protein
VVSVSQVFDADLNWLVKGHKRDESGHAFQASPMTLTSDEVELLSNYRKLHEIDKLELVEFTKLKILIKQREED